MYECADLLKVLAGSSVDFRIQFSFPLLHLPATLTGDDAADVRLRSWRRGPGPDADRRRGKPRRGGKYSNNSPKSFTIITVKV